MDDTSDKFPRNESEQQIKPVVSHAIPTLLCTEDNFWNCFYNDLKNARKIIQIISPYLTKNRTQALIGHFRI